MIVESRWNVDWQGKPKFSEKTCPSATFVHHKIPHDQTRVLTRAAAVGSRRLTAWAMARPGAAITFYLLHGVMSRKIELFVTSAMRTSIIIYYKAAQNLTILCHEFTSTFIGINYFVAFIAWLLFCYQNQYYKMTYCLRVMKHTRCVTNLALSLVVKGPLT
jgi:hypothetical protein